MKLKTLTLEELGELKQYFHDCGTSYIGVKGKAPKAINPYADFCKVENNSNLLGNFLYKQYNEDSRFRSYFDYTKEIEEILISSYKDLKVRKTIIEAISKNLEQLNLQVAAIKIEKIASLGYDSDVSDISFLNYLKNKYGENKVYAEYKTDYKKKFLESERLDINYEGDAEFIKNLEKFTSGYGFAWKWLIENSGFNDIEFSTKKLSSKFSNETPGYVGRGSGDLVYKELVTINFKYTKLKFQKEHTEYINTNGFW